MPRIACGIIVSIFANAFILAILLPLGAALNVGAVAVTALIFLPFSLLAHMALGIPFAYLLIKFRRVDFWQVLVSGCLCGVIGWLILVATSAAYSNWLWEMALSSALSTAVAYWFLRPYLLAAKMRL